MLEQVKTALEKRGYTVQLFSSAAQAREYLLSAIEPGQSVGIGGTVSVRQLEIDKALMEKGCPVYWHWTAEDRDVAHEKAAVTDVYLTSTNALTLSGLLINIDGHGNRVAAMCHGPGKVIFVVGRNKITEDYETAMERIRSRACPPNARRLELKTPCAALDRCVDCNSPDRMCNVTVILERAVSSHPMEVLLVDEDLGY